MPATIVTDQTKRQDFFSFSSVVVDSDRLGSPRLRQGPTTCAELEQFLQRGRPAGCADNDRPGLREVLPGWLVGRRHHGSHSGRPVPCQHTQAGPLGLQRLHQSVGHRQHQPGGGRLPVVGEDEEANGGNVRRLLPLLVEWLVSGLQGRAGAL